MFIFLTHTYCVIAFHGNVAFEMHRNLIASRSRASRLALIAMPIMYSPTNSTLPQLPSNSATQIPFG